MTGGGKVRFWQPADDVATELTCAYLEQGEGPLHVHEEWQFGVPEAPSTVSVGAFRRYAAHADDVTMVHPFDVHGEGSGVGAAPRWHMLYVSPSMVRRLYGGEVSRFRRPVVVDPSSAGELRELLRHSSDGAITGFEFLARIARWLRQFLLRHAVDAVTPPHIPAVERARAYLQDRPTQSVSLPDVGTMAGVTVSHLVRSFSKAVGLPPKSYHAQVRLAHARRLLAEGKAATWVAYECGFSDQSHLSRRFKERHGVTPGEFQAQYLALRRARAAESTAA
jgi:AraC-like DNA-binding protein